ncbi:WD repeat-containing protein 60 [Phlyctochytrium planicorne]|nr:WD repeat-containing protein 60 [Phlyctochytrium planicorne]
MERKAQQKSEAAPPKAQPNSGTVTRQQQQQQQTPPQPSKPKPINPPTQPAKSSAVSQPSKPPNAPAPTAPPPKPIRIGEDQSTPQNLQSINPPSSSIRIPRAELQGATQKISEGNHASQRNGVDSGSIRELPTAANAAEKINATAKVSTGKTLQQHKDVSHHSNTKRHDASVDEEVEEDPYGDDFEDYDEDFEEFDDDQDVVKESPHISEVKKALEEENQRASSRQQQQRHPPTTTNHNSKQVAATTKTLAEKTEPTLRMPNYALSKQKKRWNDLKSLVEFDVAFYEIFDLQPMTEYDLYIRSFGSMNSRQASTQWSDEVVDIDVQTDDWHVADKWTQAPPDQLIDSGVGKPDLPWLKTENDLWRKVDKRNEQNRTSGSTNLDSVSLLKFLRKSSQVMDILLEENVSAGGDSVRAQKSSYINISKGQSRVNILSFLSGRSLLDVITSPIDHRLLISLWSSAEGVFAESKIGRKGLICMWHVNDLSAPSCILCCEGNPTSICVSSIKPYLYVCGTDHGGISAWDLREPSSIHIMLTIDEKNDLGNIEPVTLVIRRPSYSTDGLFPMDDLHRDRIVMVHSLYAESAIGAEEDENGGLGSFGADDSLQNTRPLQIVSVDASGDVRLWVVSESKEKDYNAVSENDMGMAIGSHIKMVKGSGYSIKPVIRNIMVPPDASVRTCAFMPASASNFLAGLANGEVQHESRFREFCHPRLYCNNYSTTLVQTNESSFAIDSVSSIHFNPHYVDIFLVGYVSGTISLFHTQRSNPLISWQLSDSNQGSKKDRNLDKSSQAAVSQLLWSPHRPSLFYVLDTNSTVYIWDLVEQSHAPTHVIPLIASSETKVLAMTLSGASPNVVTPRSISFEANGSRKKGDEKKRREAPKVSSGVAIIFGFSDAEIEVHLLIEELVEQAIDECELFENLIKSL